MDQGTTFRVIKRIPKERYLANHVASAEAPDQPDIEVGQLGVIPHLLANYDENGNLVSNLYVKLVWVDEDGIQVGPRGLPYKVFVPLDSIEVGVQVQEKHELISELELQEASGNIPATVLGNSPLKEYLNVFFGTLGSRANLDLLIEMGVPHTMVQCIANQSRMDELIQRLINGMAYCEALELFKNGMPTVESLWNGLVTVNAYTMPSRFKRAVGNFIYVVCYHDPTSIGKTVGFYIGRTNRLSVRLGNHRLKLASDVPSLAHYSLGKKLIKKGADYKMFPLAFIPKGTSSQTDCNIMNWIELTFVCLFESFNRNMLRYWDEEHASGPRKGVAVPQAQRDLPGSDDEGELPRSAQQETYVATWSAPLAKKILQIVRTVKDSSPVLQAFKLHPDRKYKGCNWSVPLLETNGSDLVTWVRKPIYGPNGEVRMWRFDSHPRKIMKSGYLHVFAGQQHTKPTEFKLCLNLEEEFPFLQPKKSVNVIIEIMCDRVRHPCPYTDIPEVGPTDLWYEAARMGVRLEWCDDEGNWFAKYYKSGFTHALVTGRRSMKIDAATYGEVVNHIDLAWLNAIKVIGALMQWQWTTDNKLTREVLIPFNAQIRSYETDFFKQRVVVSVPPGIDVAVPLLLSTEDTLRLLAKHFPDSACGFYPWSSAFNNRAKRLACDDCQALNKSCNSRVVASVEDVEMLQCTRCAYLRRFCTWTPHIATDPSAHRLIYVSRPHYPTHSIPEPTNSWALQEDEEVETDEMMVEIDDENTDHGVEAVTEQTDSDVAQVAHETREAGQTVEPMVGIEQTVVELPDTTMRLGKASQPATGVEERLDQGAKCAPTDDKERVHVDSPTGMVVEAEGVACATVEVDMAMEPTHEMKETADATGHGPVIDDIAERDEQLCQVQQVDPVQQVQQGSDAARAEHVAEQVARDATKTVEVIDLTSDTDEETAARVVEAREPTAEAVEKAGSPANVEQMTDVAVEKFSDSTAIANKVAKSVARVEEIPDSTADSDEDMPDLVGEAEGSGANIKEIPDSYAEDDEFAFSDADNKEIPDSYEEQGMEF
ncbi:hypothetical protein HIM_05709 [Hirsutella minnesotensis 3608]|uniref:Uncharacterized protein n=1 Tax=Hirsutella minnesotensis 3608 TaxID=1043627 RepID=A0A0F7ZUJ6_9HYPO|nr:hypothetical protein HIM_05709 [Hirsutella minnesotensis 3608]